MPEGPEVQTIVNDLSRKIIGRKITGVWTDWPKTVKTGFKALEKGIKVAKIQKVRRRGKNILIDLDKNRLLLIHQKMTGHLLVGKWSIKKVSSIKYQVSSVVRGAMQERVNDFIHLIFYLDNGQMLALSDMRKFAKVLFGPTEEIEEIKELKELGPDPLDPKTTFTRFSTAITKRSRAIKQVLMDQSAVSGIGNIYASDILWLARIHPLRPANKLKEGELKVLWSASKKVLKQATKLRGTSTADFRDTSGKKGGYGNVVLAYQRTGEPCKRCKTPIKRIKIGGRSSHFCPKCQRTRN
ncbi:MAG: bifunctional DNA-formamidopyrimidine glycosylase/DNA-(apurinic or apyrimidinic site) lyase [Candidatus Colwellbacteria bacterium]|nr:bifunctional DNA-formamidopyrimidine glycosylase/DNA-(apurinic or apyrimidinic site) lyase [Candidatus Colwellbacteria bacterium]